MRTDHGLKETNLKYTFKPIHEMKKTDNQINEKLLIPNETQETET